MSLFTAGIAFKGPFQFKRFYDDSMINTCVTDLQQGAGLDELQKSLSTPTML